MNNSKILDHIPESPKMVAGDGDGIKRNILRCPLSSSKKYKTPIKRNDMKFPIELALKEIHGSHKIKKPYIRRNAETVTVDTPTRITKRKCKPFGNDRAATIYGTPRSSSAEAMSRNYAGRKIFKYLLLQSWRKSMVLRKELSESLQKRNEKITQLDIQIEVLKNLRKLESARREETQKKYQELQRDANQSEEENTALKNEIESMRIDCNSKVKELHELHQQLDNYKNIFEEKQQALRVLKEKLEKEKEKSRRFSTDKKTYTEHNVKLENMLNIHKEKVENLTTQIRMLQNSKNATENALQKSEKTCETYAEKLGEQIALAEMYKSQIMDYEKERIEMNRELKNLQMHLDVAHDEYSLLKCRNDTIEKDILDISQKLDQNKEQFAWNMMRRGMSNTYCVIKCLANLMLPAIQSNLRY